VHWLRRRTGSTLWSDVERSTKDEQMSPRDSRPIHAPSGVDLDQTRRRFLLARAQCSAHAAAADYLRVRDMGQQAVRGMASGTSHHDRHPS
jgi:hypothetical protein